jgi:hypothetical protein
VHPFRRPSARESVRYSPAYETCQRELFSLGRLLDAQHLRIFAQILETIPSSSVATAPFVSPTVAAAAARPSPRALRAHHRMTSQPVRPILSLALLGSLCTAPRSQNVRQAVIAGVAPIAAARVRGRNLERVHAYPMHHVKRRGPHPGWFCSDAVQRATGHAPGHADATLLERSVSVVTSGRANSAGEPESRAQVTENRGTDVGMDCTVIALRIAH